MKYNFYKYKRLENMNLYDNATHFNVHHNPTAPYVYFEIRVLRL